MEKTPDQIKEQIDSQNDALLKIEKTKLRVTALDAITSISTSYKTGSVLSFVRDCEKVYQWLIKDLK